jgi:hypothetical protein
MFLQDPILITKSRYCPADRIKVTNQLALKQGMVSVGAMWSHEPLKAEDNRIRDVTEG